MLLRRVSREKLEPEGWEGHNFKERSWEGLTEQRGNTAWGIWEKGDHSRKRTPSTEYLQEHVGG